MKYWLAVSARVGSLLMLGILLLKFFNAGDWLNVVMALAPTLHLIWCPLGEEKK